VTSNNGFERTGVTVLFSVAPPLNAVFGRT